MSHSSYMYRIVNEEIHTTIKRLVYELRHGKPFDFIAVRGFSGVIPGSIVSYLLKKPLIVVRKPGVPSHATMMKREILTKVIPKSGYRYVFLDDQVSAGNTIRAVQEALADGKYVGKVLYNGQASVWEP